jgi:hypothetical protein
MIFLLKYHQNPPSPQEMEHKKREERENTIEKKKEKRGRKRKTRRVSSNKGEVNILSGEKHFNFKNILFDVILFSSAPSYHFKNHFENH